MSDSGARSLDVDKWNERDVLDFLIEEGLLEYVNFGLINGQQLGNLGKDSCMSSIDASMSKLEREKYGARLYSAIQGAKKGLGGSGFAKSGNKSPRREKQNSGGFDYQRLGDHEEALFGDLENQIDDEDYDDDDPDNHAFPPFWDRPGRNSVIAMFLVLVGSILVCTVFKKEFTKLAGYDEDETDEWIKSYLRYASIPVLMVPFTYAHIYLALWMTFYPIHFQGCWQIPGTNVGFPIGWQGIVPFKCVEMAQLACRMMTTKLLKVDEVFARLDPDGFAKVLQPHIAKQMAHVVEDIALQEAPTLWKLLPNAVKAQVFKEAAKESPNVIKEMLPDIQENMDECFDLEQLVVSIMVNDMELSNNMFIQCSDRELAFIRNSGAWMGGLFGIVQVAIVVSISHSSSDTLWLLPLIGFIAGAITNWIALFMIFNPVNPIRLCGGRIILQGLFLTRQNKVSALYGKIVQGKVLTAENLNRALMKGPRSDKVMEIAKKHIRNAYEKTIAPLKSKPISFTLPSSFQESLERIGDKLTTAMAEDMYNVMRHGEDFMNTSFDLENTIRQRMKALPPCEFEGLLHPVFQQDEWKLVLCGGVLGLVFGFIQAKFIGF